MSVSAAALVIISLMASVSAVAETHRFEPSQYDDTFSFAHKPVPSIKPGDRVITKTIDVRGFDADNQQGDERPNPQTGPFFVEGAEPGDVLVVRFGKIEPAGRPPGPAASLHPTRPIRPTCTTRPSGSRRPRRGRSTRTAGWPELPRKR